MITQKSRLAAVVSYLGIVGWIAAWYFRDKEDEFTANHLNQSLCVLILSVMGVVVGKFPVLGLLSATVVGIASVVLWLIGLIQALKGEYKPLPFIGTIQIIRPESSVQSFEI